MPAKFPRKRPDGSFSLELVFRARQAVEADGFGRWVSDWSEANREWVREWRGPEHQIVKRDVLRWSDAFTREPYVVNVATEAVVLRLDAVPDPVFWKDWMVRLIEAVVAAFPDLAFDEARDVD